MPSKLKNPATKRVPKNYSLELRVQDLVLEYSKTLGRTESDYVNEVLKTHLGIVD